MSGSPDGLNCPRAGSKQLANLLQKGLYFCRGAASQIPTPELLTSELLLPAPCFRLAVSGSSDRRRAYRIPAPDLWEPGRPVFPGRVAMLAAPPPHVDLVVGFGNGLHNLSASAGLPIGRKAVFALEFALLAGL